MSHIQQTAEQNQNNQQQQVKTTQKKESKSRHKAKQKPIKAKQRPIKAKQKPIQAKQRPIQAKQTPINKSNGSTQGLPEPMKTNMEAMGGVDLSDVKVHNNSSQPQKVGALAFAQGSDIHLAPGQEKHLGHEAWHTVQQKQGRVQPTTMQAKGLPVNDDPQLEKEADVMGRKAIQMKPISTNIIQKKKNDNSVGVIQRITPEEQKLIDEKKHELALGEKTMDLMHEYDSVLIDMAKGDKAAPNSLAYSEEILNTIITANYTYDIKDKKVDGFGTRLIDKLHANIDSIINNIFLGEELAIGQINSSIAAEQKKRDFYTNLFFTSFSLVMAWTPVPVNIIINKYKQMAENNALSGIKSFAYGAAENLKSWQTNSFRSAINSTTSTIKSFIPKAATLPDLRKEIEAKYQITAQNFKRSSNSFLLQAALGKDREKTVKNVARLKLEEDKSGIETIKLDEKSASLLFTDFLHHVLGIIFPQYQDIIDDVAQIQNRSRQHYLANLVLNQGYLVEENTPSFTGMPLHNKANNYVKIKDDAAQHAFDVLSKDGVVNNYIHPYSLAYKTLRKRLDSIGLAFKGSEKDTLNELKNSEIVSIQVKDNQSLLTFLTKSDESLVEYGKIGEFLNDRQRKSRIETNSFKINSIDFRKDKIKFLKTPNQEIYDYARGGALHFNAEGYIKEHRESSIGFKYDRDHDMDDSHKILLSHI